MLAENEAFMDWNHAEDIGIELLENHPDIDPLTVRFTNLHKMVMELDGFTGDRDGSNEARLEAIQMAWLEEYRDQ
jgi:FeS assembly protein IscX